MIRAFYTDGLVVTWLDLCKAMESLIGWLVT